MDLLAARWRPGRKVGRTLYAMVNPDASDDDVLLGMVDSSELAQRICLEHNLALNLSLHEQDA